MKYLKLFENFNQDDLEDIKWILVELNDNPKLIKNELNGNLLVYEIDSYNHSNLNATYARLKNIGYELFTFVENLNYVILVIINSDYFEEAFEMDDIISSDNGPVLKVALKWLTDKYNNLTATNDKNPIERRERVRYIDENRIIQVSCPINKDYDDVIFINRDIWNFLMYIFDIERNELVAVVRKWLKDTFKLNHIDNLNLKSTTFELPLPIE
jgi:hypothetical protein